ncbi:MAG: hypothetical protein KBE09_04350 [Candidatus Pacebacteria bacterium]|nr:hypothetical protein [Candidatus Paceibacterota bacterium]
MRLFRLLGAGVCMALMMPLAVSALTEDELRQQIFELLSHVTQLQGQLGGATTPTTGGTASTNSNRTSNSDVLNGGLTISRYLERGMSGTDVSRLQQFLSLDASIYPEGDITGFYGPLTERAVERFQVACGIVQAGNYQSTGYGRVGPRTRTALATGCNSIGGGPSGLPTQVGAFLKVTPIAGPAPLNVVAEATVNASQSCEAATYIVNFGDGSPTYPVSVTAGRCAPLTQAITHTYQAPGNYTLSLSIGTHKTQVQVQVGGGVQQPQYPTTMTTFEQCVAAAGNTITSGYPRQCRTPQGQVFYEGSGTTPYVPPYVPPTTGDTVAFGVPVTVSPTFSTYACNNDPLVNQIIRVNWGDNRYDDVYTHSLGLTQGGCGSSLTRAVSHTYGATGTYQITLQELRTTTGGSPALYSTQNIRTITVGSGTVVTTANKLTVSPAGGPSPLSVAAQFTIRPGDPYEVDWGDGSTPTGAGAFTDRPQLAGNTTFTQAEQLVSMQHTYNGGATRTVTLKLGSYEQSGGFYVWRTRFYTKQVIVSGTPTTNPTTPTGTDAFTASPATGNAPLNVTFNVTINGAKSCNGGEYSIDFGDGQYASLPFPADLCNSQSFVVTHRYESGGTFSAKLYDRAQSQTAGLTPKQTATIVTSGAPPSNSEVIYDYAITPGIGGDPRKVEARFTLKDACTGYSLTWGDGTTDSLSQTTTACGTVGVNVIKQHTYNTNGTFNIQVTATSGGTQTARTATITISS